MATLAAGRASWALWALAMLSLPVIAWLDRRSRQAGRADLLQLATGSVPPCWRW